MQSDVQTTHAIMLVFYNKQVYHEKSYSFMSLGFIQEQLAQFHNKRISISAIKYHLAKIKRKKLMLFYKNPCGRRSDGTIYRRPSNRMFSVRGLKLMAAYGLEIVSWLWDVVTGKVKLPRGKGQGYYEKQRLAAREAPKPVNGIRKLISSIGKSFDNLKLFSW